MTNEIKTPEDARALADSIVTLLTQISANESASEREQQAVAKRYAAINEPLEADAKEKQQALQKYLKKESARAALFSPGLRSGETALAVFGYRDTPRTIAALNGSLSAALKSLHEKGKCDYLLIEQPPVKLSLNMAALNTAQLGDGALADLGLKWSFKTKFFIEPKQGTITKASTANA